MKGLYAAISNFVLSAVYCVLSLNDEKAWRPVYIFRDIICEATKFLSSPYLFSEYAMVSIIFNSALSTANSALFKRADDTAHPAICR
jgi:hypothetical protein